MHGTPEKLIEPDSAVLSTTCTCVVTLPLFAGIAQSDVPALEQNRGMSRMQVRLELYFSFHLLNADGWDIGRL